MYSNSSFSVTKFAKEIPHYEHEKTMKCDKEKTCDDFVNSHALHSV